MHPSEHMVQFYQTDDFLLDALSEFIGAGLGSGAACIVIATQAHREGLSQRLQVNGLDPTRAHAQGKYFALDAVETLSQLLVEGSLDQERFAQVVSGLIERTVKGKQRVRIFGEIVALLWEHGNQTAALQLEAFWNELRSPTPLSFLCAYPMSLFAGSAHAELFTRMCELHSRIIPDERYTRLASQEERLRTVSLFQQKALSLEAEITQRRAAEERLRISENRYHRLFEASIDGILLVDPCRGLITDANPSLLHLLGSTREQVVDQELWQVGLLPDQPTQHTFLRQVQQERVLHHEMEFTTTGGDHRYVEWVSTLFQANGHEVLQCNLRDITDRKALEQQREAFVGLVTHELKNPLTALQGNIQLAQRRLVHLLSRAEQLEEEQQRLLEDVLTMLARSHHPLRVQQRLINDLLDLSHIQQDKVELRLASCNLVGLVCETVQDYQAAHPSRLITVDLPEEDPILVYADRDRLQQVLSNYLTNALKFSPVSEPVQVGMRLEAETIRVWVADHGPGLSAEQQAHIWQRFYQAPRTPVQNGWKAGLGLGLYICQQLIRRQQGEVGVESLPGQGATFWFTLPVQSSSCPQS